MNVKTKHHKQLCFRNASAPETKKGKQNIETSKSMAWCGGCRIQLDNELITVSSEYTRLLSYAAFEGSLRLCIQALQIKVVSNTSI